MKLALSVFACLFAAPVLFGQDAAPESVNSAAPAEAETSPVAPPQAEGTTPETPQISEQDVIKEMTGLLSTLVTKLSKVRDEASAAASAQEISGMMAKLFSVDYAAYEELDEEEVAAGLTDLFNDLEMQVSRLYESNFYGNSTLKKVFGAEEEPFTPPPGKDEDVPSEEEASATDDAEDLNEPD